MPEAVQLDVHPLTPERFADLAALFEEGGDPKWCWCVYFRFRGRDWSNSTTSENRAALEGHWPSDRWRPVSSATATAALVGWVSLGPRGD